ncbi:MAG: class I mannose-6-phosphate isomerase [Anaerolineae bacterium]|nr:class I mannose-6-phosphate isomerase [Anaerolineae bacterium]
MTRITPPAWRKTSQYLMPVSHAPTAPGAYDIYPAHPLPSGAIRVGFAALAETVAQAGTVVIDGYPGVLWEHFAAQLKAALGSYGQAVVFSNVKDAMLPGEQIEALIAPYLGGDDPLFGYRYPGGLADFFDPERLADLLPAPDAINVLYGCGAALAGWKGALIYVDVPKNEIQFRARSLSVANLGLDEALPPKPAYKRSYFIDWVVANRHKAALLPAIDWMVDEQRADEPAIMPGEALRQGLEQLTRSVFRARPWFEPGPWGGQWIKSQMPQLAQEVPNYAWSFELISPENGLLFASDGALLEVSFDMLMYQDHHAVLGQCAPNFQYEFPIRYDFLDTVDGGNLSVQCHPRPEYIRRNFGETFTQDECYYILDCVPGARVYLGFQENIVPQEFKSVLLESAQTAKPVEIERFVNAVEVEKHDLLLIPNGTIHGAGIGNLVLEISATPYIFTFKMYDWLRLDLDGKPRSLNIERAFQNLYFDRRGERIHKEFVSHPTLLEQGADYCILHLPTHPHHFYDVHRLEFSGAVAVETGGLDGSCHVLSLVEGKTVLVETADGTQTRFNYAETFVIPAAAGRYRLISEDGSLIKVVKTFVKPRETWEPGSVPDAR